MMTTTTILRTIQRYHMVRPGERVLVGLSGGADSVALTAVLVELSSELGIEIVAGHLHHGLRPEADDDEAFCAELARSLGVAFVSGRVDIAARASAQKRSIEDEGRRARYAFLLEQAAHHECRHVAVGHTMDDQAETFLMRLVRGSGPRGLSSAYPVVKKGGIDIIRPLIDVRRREVVLYLEGRGLDYRDDASNLDRRFTRNRLRHDVLPIVRDALNPNLVETLARSAAILRDEESYMDAEARKAFVQMASSSEAQVRLSVAALLAVHPAIGRRMIRLAIEHASGNTENISSGHVADVLSLLEDGKSGREIHISGVLVERSFDELSIAGREREPSANGYNGFDYRLTIPAKLQIKEGRGLLTAHLVESVEAGDEPGAAAGGVVVVGVEDGISELRVRSPRPSDRFRPLGAPGSKSLARYLMERKVAKRDRRHVPLVVRGDEDEILWVCGHGVSETARLGAGRRRLHLEWMKL